MLTHYLRKVRSWSPKKYKYIPYGKALKEYDLYLETIFKSGTDHIKTFEEWLKTEI